ncbi:MAG: tetratricopeptide repeat protein [Lentisphaeraceae bacterium]|nr:tetratricopeptide repeat protein [Lentisphaeraceae bacterium]
MKRIASVLLKSFLLLLLLSCVNTSYSRLDEVAINDELVDIILGQFPHHGKAFYENEIKIKEAKLIETPNDFELRNDIAVAYLKLAKWKDALFHFDLNENKYPSKYKTHANLGVMYKKMGEYEKAAFHIKKSLEIKPEGHMGLGDYYLKMIEWKHNYTQDQKTNFLGIPYNDSAHTAKVANKEYVITLIKNDYQFIDAYLVLGDILFEEKNYQLALRAYMRARTVNEQEKFGDIGFKAYHKMTHTVNQIKKNKGKWQVIDTLRYRSQLEKEIENAELWLGEFQKTEKQLIANNETISFEKVRESMEENGYSKPQIMEAVVFKGLEYDPTTSAIFAFFLIIITTLLGYYFYNKRKMRKLLKSKAIN